MALAAAPSPCPLDCDSSITDSVNPNLTNELHWLHATNVDVVQHTCVTKVLWVPQKPSTLLQVGTVICFLMLQEIDGRCLLYQRSYDMILADQAKRLWCPYRYQVIKGPPT